MIEEHEHGPYCEQCGDCQKCHGGDRCLHSDDGRHSYPIEEVTDFYWSSATFVDLEDYSNQDDRTEKLVITPYMLEWLLSGQALNVEIQAGEYNLILIYQGDK